MSKTREGYEVTTKAGPTAPKTPEGRELSGVSIDPSKNNGFSVRVSYRAKPSKDKDGCSVGWMEPDTYTFESLDSLFTFLGKTFGKK